MMLVFAGDLTAASVLMDEQSAVTEATGGNLGPYAAMYLSAMSGRHAETVALVETTIREVPQRGRASAWRSPSGPEPFCTTASGLPGRWPPRSAPCITRSIPTFTTRG
jgi:hypothetical protein